ncbi:glycoside hydrolase family 3 N-terminal domain-containing protein [Subtercola vilae]|uniref:beta-N-acetylhexosaminidase n=1 Tax=Subtercola vilae TaxID=2056433 RepID=A0A4T2BXR4_9MICO|nr:glycoside hydrolase family 3 N-terminal domain-containing protein [Subtercola vilae]TIH36320.1 glycoside hydrolase family 3 protein [Subtercola vilae]
MNAVAGAIAVSILLSGCSGASVAAEGSSPAPSTGTAEGETPALTATPSASPVPAVPAVPRVPAVPPVPGATDLDDVYARTRMHSMSLVDKVSLLFMVQVAGTDPAPMQAYLAANRPGGFLLLGSNVPATADALAAQLSGVGTATGLSPLISIDEEGGDVARLGQDTFPGADQLKSMPVQATTDAFTQRAALLTAAGVSVNFGTVADVTANPSSFIFDRVLGTDPAAASERVAASVAAENDSVFSTLKHFPGHGETTGDSHTSIPSTEVTLDRWQIQDAPPFVAGISAGAGLVMFGHLSYSSVDTAPASLSLRWHQILRDDLHFTGVAVTDDMLMLQDSGLPQFADPSANAVAAVAAGNDLLLYDSAIDMAPPVAAIVAAVQAGTISEQQIDASATRVLQLQRVAWLRTHPAP